MKKPSTPIANCEPSDAKAASSFEQNLDALEKILAELEKGEAPLEKQLELFESGVSLSRTCLQRLEAVERKVEQLLVNASGGLTTGPFAET